MSRPKEWGKLQPYRFSFFANGKRHAWIRFHLELELAFSDSIRVAKREYPDARAFMIESDQDDADIRRSWGLEG